MPPAACAQWRLVTQTPSAISRCLRATSFPLHSCSGHPTFGQRPKSAFVRLPPSDIYTFFLFRIGKPAFQGQHPPPGLTGHYHYTIHFFPLSFLFFLHTQLGLRRSALFLLFLFLFFSLPEDGTEIGRKHRQMLEAVCLTLQQQTRFNISRCFRAISTLFLHSSVLRHSLSFFSLFFFLTFLVLHSIFFRRGRVGRRHREMSETVWVSLSSAKMYTGVQAWVHMFFCVHTFLLPACVAISANAHPRIYTFRRPSAIGIAYGLLVHMFIYISCFTFYIFVYTFICNFI